MRDSAPVRGTTGHLQGARSSREHLRTSRRSSEVFVVQRPAFAHHAYERYLARMCTTRGALRDASGPELRRLAALLDTFLAVEVTTTQLHTALLSIWVHSASRRTGHAEHLLRSFAEHAPGYGVENLEALIDRANTPALRFFAKQEFAACGSIDGYARSVRVLPLDP
jgi:ribosomal protein S18 acetylase RimI-like enzyme